MATPPAPMPPEVAAQASPEAAQSAFMAQGVGQPQPGMQLLQQVAQKAQGIVREMEDVKQMVQQIHPPLLAVFAPMEVALRQLVEGMQKIAQRSGMAQGSPVMQSPPQGAGNPGANPPSPMGG